MKNVAYLIGAGAVQAELELSGIESDTTMRGISENVLEMSRRINGEYYQLVQDFGLPANQDVELMISLFESFTDSKPNSFENVHKELRRLFRNYLISQITRKSILPRLLISLLHLHRKHGQHMNEDGENLLGVLTTNYDSVIEKAFCKVHKGLNCGCRFISEDYSLDKTVPYLLKLHGSFNWRINTNKLKISKTFERETHEDDYSGWIPPSVYKKPSTRLFQDIWDRSRKLLTHCDILRVIGSSLRNEDWCLISLIFTSQISSKREGGKAFEIELIVPEHSAVGSENQPGIMRRLPFLADLKPLSALPVFEEDMLQGNTFHNWLLKKANEIDRKTRIMSRDAIIMKMLYGEE